MRTIVVVVGLLLTGTVSAATFSSATPLTHVRYGASSVPARASIASNGHGFVAVWQTDRDQRVARVSPAETSVGFPIGKSGTSAPVIAAVGDGYVVVSGQSDLEATFLDGAAHPAGAALPIEHAATMPRVAVSGDIIAVVYSHRLTTELRLELALLAKNGAVLKRVFVATDLFPNDMSTYDVAATPTGFAVTLVSAAGTRVFVLDLTGLVVATIQLEAPVPYDQIQPRTAIATDGQTYMALWTAPDGALRAMNLSAEGKSLRSVTVARSAQKSPATRIVQSAIAFDGQRYVCGYLDGYTSYTQSVNGDAYLIWIDTNLTTTEPRPIRTDNFVFNIVVAAANGSSLVVWAANGGSLVGSGRLFAAVAENDRLGAAFPVAIAAGEQLTPAAVSNGTATVVAWNEPAWDSDTLTTRIVAGILDSAGHWRELGPLSSLAYAAMSSPVVASNGSDFLVVWPGGMARIGAGGAFLDAVPVVPPLNFVPTSAVWDGRRYVVAGNAYWPDEGIAAFTVGASGAANDLHLVRPPRGGDSVRNPKLAYGGGVVMMAFSWWEPPCIGGVQPCFSTMGARAAQLTDASASGPETSIAPDDSILSTDIAWNGSEFLTVSIDYFTPIATRLSPDGKSLGTASIKQVAFERLGRPSISVNGTDFLVAWRSDSPARRSYMAVVHADGSMSETTVLDPGTTTSDPVLLNTSPGPLLLSTRAIDAEPYFGASRITIQTTDAASIGSAPNLTGAMDGPLANLHWTSVANAIEYRIEYRSGSDGWRELDLPQGLATSLSIRLHSNTTKFEFRVRGWSSSGTSPYSNPVVLVLPKRRAA